MKRVLTFLALMLLPLSVMAMTPVSDSTLSDVTGQAGVNINADLTMNITIGTLAWGDADGIGGFNSGTDTSPWATVGAGGYVGVNNFNITNLRIKARESDTFNGYHTSTNLKPITIDVATGTKNGAANTTFVRFGLGSLEIHMGSMSLQVALGARNGSAQTNDLAAGGLNQVLGTANIGPLGVYINPDSYIDIYAHAGCGVNLEFDVIIDQLDMTYLSWGDTDGLAGGNLSNIPGIYWIGTNTPGYIGLQNFVVGGPITVAGTVAIDVASLAANAGIYSGYGVAPILGQGACTILHISFPTNFEIDVTGPITANVRLDSLPALNSANAGTLGDIYISSFNVNILANSWVDIWAH